MGLKSTGGGEIVQVQGGHIIRATGRKDRHSKVFTAKGPRDRRVRLAAHTAIQFYDVQDRLGYDRPSKAVDWLINKAKASIDKLTELPPWDPTTVASQHHLVGADNANTDNVGSSNQISLGVDHLSNLNNNINHNHNNDDNNNNNNNNNNTTSQFYGVPQCVDSQSLADSMIKSFFPTTNTSGQNNSLNFQNYPHDQFISRGGSTHHPHHQQNTQDLCLSLHTHEDPGAAGGGSQAHPSHPHQDHFGFDAGWGQQQDIGRFTRLMGWAGDSSGGAGEGRGGGLMFNSPQLSAQALLLSQQHAAAGSTTTPATYQQQQHQRGTLQSSYSPFARAFEHSDSGIGHGSADNSFMGFYIPSQQIHGDLHGAAAAASLSNNRASSSSLSPDSSQH